MILSEEVLSGIDQGIREAVRILNYHGWITSMSCEGHFNGWGLHGGHPYVSFDKDFHERDGTREKLRDLVFKSHGEPFNLALLYRHFPMCRYSADRQVIMVEQVILAITLSEPSDMKLFEDFLERELE